jgi:hypothetical protein
MSPSCQFLFINTFDVIKGRNAHDNWHEALNKQGKVNGNSGFEVTHLSPIGDDAQWRIPILPRSLTWKFPTISPFRFLKIVNFIKNSDVSRKIVVLFESNLNLAIFIFILRKCLKNSSAIVNLWPSYKFYNLVQNPNRVSKFQLSILNLMTKDERYHLTVDTGQLKDLIELRLGLRIGTFPVPSSLFFKTSERVRPSHHKVSIVNKGYSFSKLKLALEQSCKSCTFIMTPGISNIDTPWRKELSQIDNLVFLENNPNNEEYEKYIDMHDSAILLYNPIPSDNPDTGGFSSYCASGKLLDYMMRRLPVSAPIQGTEWANQLRNWGSYHLFDWYSDDQVKGLFSHPLFVGSYLDSRRPPFSPADSLQRLYEMVQEPDRKKIFKFVTPENRSVGLIVTTLFPHLIFSVILELAYRMIAKSNKYLKLIWRRIARH